MRVQSFSDRKPLADGSDAPRSVPGPDPHRRVHGDLLAVDNDVPAPRTELRKPLRVEGHPSTRAQNVPLLLDDVEQPVPGEIEGHTFGLVQHDAQ
jgi:hypothetical protein